MKTEQEDQCEIVAYVICWFVIRKASFFHLKSLPFPTTQHHLSKKLHFK